MCDMLSVFVLWNRVEAVVKSWVCGYYYAASIMELEIILNLMTPRPNQMVLIRI